ncbi:hypothetical protein [Absidia glauca]|uniref:SET domain-containing protein n=1 Tax=Absidia glauca TaxID=4829 RepID=A0A168QDH5_ABSGL|nr:hypothetical protein [Absidia glauca]
MMLDTLTQDLDMLKLIGDSNTQTSLLKVQDLPMKGRGYVATQDLAAGTLIHIASPLATVVSEEWRPETCMGCFAFSYPKRMKVKTVVDQDLVAWWQRSVMKKSTVKKPFSLGHVAFCTDQCKQNYLETTGDDAWYTWLTCMYRLEHYTPTKTTTMYGSDDDLEDPTTVLDDDKALRMYLDKLWDRAATTTSTDDLDDSDRTMCRFIVSCLVQHKTSGTDFDALWDMQDNELGHIRHLQGSTTEIQHAMHLYQHIVSAMTSPIKSASATVPVVLGPHDLTPGLFRAIYYREMANSFGLWEQSKDGDAVTDDLELLGFGIYPSAVYFNHACEANAIKIRHGRAMHFYTKRAVARGEEVCISYGNVDAPFQERRQRLLDHYHFVCACTRCLSEL